VAWRFAELGQCRRTCVPRKWIRCRPDFRAGWIQRDPKGHSGIGGACSRRLSIAGSGIAGDLHARARAALQAAAILPGGTIRIASTACSPAALAGRSGLAQRLARIAPGLVADRLLAARRWLTARRCTTWVRSVALETSPARMPGTVAVRAAASCRQDVRSTPRQPVGQQLRPHHARQRARFERRVDSCRGRTTPSWRALDQLTRSFQKSTSHSPSDKACCSAGSYNGDTWSCGAGARRPNGGSRARSAPRVWCGGGIAAVRRNPDLQPCSASAGRATARPPGRQAHR